MYGPIGPAYQILLWYFGADTAVDPCASATVSYVDTGTIADPYILEYDADFEIYFSDEFISSEIKSGNITAAFFTKKKNYYDEIINSNNWPPNNIDALPVEIPKNKVSITPLTLYLDLETSSSSFSNLSIFIELL